MAQEKDSEGNFSRFRTRAEETLSSKPKPLDMEDISALSPAELQRMVHELSVHQIELEMQNDELREAQIELEDLKDKYLDLYDFAPVGYVTLNEKGLVLEANLAMVRLLGVERQSLTKMFFSHFVSQEFGDAFHLHLQQVFETQSKWTCEIKMAGEDGTNFYAQLVSVAAQDETGQFNRCQTMISDISERKKAEEELRESEARYRALFEGAAEGILVADVETRKLSFANPAICNMLGYEMEELVQLNVSDIHPTESLQHVAAEFQALARGEKLLVPNLPCLRKDGSVFYADIAGRPVVLEKRLMNVGFFTDVTQRKKMEDALRRSEERFRSLIDQAADAIFVHDFNGRFLEVNRQACNSLGYTRYELLSMSISDIDHDVVPRGDSAKFWTNLPATFEARHRGKDGTIVPVEVRLGSIAYGETKVILGMVRDLTERKEAEEALRESEDRYRNFFTTSRECIFMTMLDGQIIDANEASLETLGYAPGEKDELLRTNVANLYANPAERDAHVALVSKQGFSKEYPVDLRKKDGTIIHTLITTVARRGPDGTVIGFQGTVRDITEQKRSEELLRESEQNFVEAFQGSPAAMTISSVASKKYVDVNRVFLNTTGYTREEVIGRTSEELQIFADYLDRDRLIAQINTNGHAYGVELEFRMKSGEIRNFLTSVGTIQISGQPHFLASIVDITERKQAEEAREILRNQLAQAQKMEALGTLTGGIAHDFNNLLTIVNGYTELILSEKTENDPYYSDLQKVLETGRKGAEMVQRLLVFSQKAEISPKPLDLNLIVENSVSLMGRTFPKIIDIETVFGKDLSDFYADAGQVEHVIINLSINAKEAMPQGGRLRIETRRAFVDDAYCRLQPGAKPGQHVLLEVSDTGAGIDAKTLARIFEPFFTTKGWDFKKGTGLGLSVAKGIVEQHGGWITCQSEPGQGTTFTVYFPIVQDSLQGKSPKPQTQTAGGGVKILLVDDEELLRDLGKRILERAGYEVITALNGKEALEIYAREQSNIAIVVLDLVMPKMGGEQCLEELVKIDRHVRVVVSTGHPLDSKERESLGVHAKGFVNKPYQLKQLVQTVKDALGSGRM